MSAMRDWPPDGPALAEELVGPVASRLRELLAGTPGSYAGFRFTPLVAATCHQPSVSLADGAEDPVLAALTVAFQLGVIQGHRVAAERQRLGLRAAEALAAADPAAALALALRLLGAGP